MFTNNLFLPYIDSDGLKLIKVKKAHEMLAKSTRDARNDGNLT